MVIKLGVASKDIMAANIYICKADVTTWPINKSSCDGIICLRFTCQVKRPVHAAIRPAMESPKGLEGMLSEPRTSAVSKGLVGEVAKICREAPSGPSSEVLKSLERTRSLFWSSAARELPAMPLHCALLGSSGSSSLPSRSSVPSCLQTHSHQRSISIGSHADFLQASAH